MRYDILSTRAGFTGLATVCLAALTAPINLDAQELWGGLEAGPYAVGFTTMGLRDSTRTLPGDGTPRPVQISLWYPARAAGNGDDDGGAEPSMTYRDYFLLTANEVTLEPLGPGEAGAAIARFKEFLASNGVAGSVVDDWFSRPVAALREAPAAPGRFPLILIAQGNFHAAYNQAILAEYLASHGYAVATGPSQSRIDGPPERDDPVIRAARAQAGDLDFMVDALHHDPRVDADRLGVVAHSFGARSAFLLLLDHDVSAFVSLDGGIANRRGKAWIDDIDFDPASICTPILHFYQDVDETVLPDFELLSSLDGAERLLVRVDSLYHPHFTSLGLASGVVPGFRIGPPSPEVVSKAVAVGELTRRFLDAHTRGTDPGIGRAEVEAVGGAWFSTRRLRPRPRPAHRSPCAMSSR